MKANRKNNRRANIFEAYSVSDTGASSHGPSTTGLATEPKPAVTTGSSRECVRELGNEKGAAKRLIDRVVEDSRLPANLWKSQCDP